MHAVEVLIARLLAPARSPHPFLVTFEGGFKGRTGEHAVLNEDRSDGWARRVLSQEQLITLFAGHESVLDGDFTKESAMLCLMIQHLPNLTNGEQTLLQCELPKGNAARSLFVEGSNDFTGRGEPDFD
ncbi:MAG: hypothetical protein AAF938_19035 [Myxococcota bacterium]